MFLAVLQEYIFDNVEVRKMREVFRAKMYCKMSNFLLVFVGFDTFYRKI